jgi:mono/diheme cytochrome c family protein
MKHNGILIGAVVLLLAGAAGLVVAFGAGAYYPAAASGTPASSLGRQIYYTGVDALGTIPRTIPAAGMMGFGMMGDLSCVDCHGPDGRGGRIATMFGTIDFADIRYSVLTTARSDNGTSTPAWTDADIARAIRDGIEPNGQPLKAPMPRWAMSDDDVNGVIAYLKELSKP